MHIPDDEASLAAWPATRSEMWDAMKERQSAVRLRDWLTDILYIADKRGSEGPNVHTRTTRPGHRASPSAWRLCEVKAVIRSRVAGGVGRIENS